MFRSQMPRSFYSFPCSDLSIIQYDKKTQYESIGNISDDDEYQEKGNQHA